MVTAQRRGAVRHEKFHFRKNMYVQGGSGGKGTTASLPGSNSSVDGGFVKKEKKLRNCFPPLPTPRDGVEFTHPIEEEYEEMTMNEIINGKVLETSFRHALTYQLTGRGFPWASAGCV